MLDLVQKLNPENVVIENVPGLKWMQQGVVLDAIVNSLEEDEYSVSVLNLKAEEFGVPQRRRRVFVVGRRDGSITASPSGFFSPLVRGKTRADVSLGTKNQPPPVSVSEAISDLPLIVSGGGEDLIEYLESWTDSDYQRLMRGSLSFENFISKRTEQG
jgi:DNA (cytosine-5)-methyltransferase 1